MVYFIYPSRFQSHLKYFHSIVVKLFTTKVAYLNILTQSIAITNSMLNFGNFLTKNAITFDQKEIEKKISRRHEILLRIQCCIKKCQNRKKNQLFP